MAQGPGKYDDLCLYVRDASQAQGVLLIVLDGEKGSGFSVQAPLPVMANLPAMLRHVADQIEKDVS